VFVPLDEWLREHMVPVVFLGAVVDAIGIPFPGRLMLITVGSVISMAVDTGTSATLAIALATIGTVVGDHVWYAVGHFKGRRLFELYCRLIRLPECRIKVADRVLRRFGGLALVIARLAAALRLVLVPLAVSRGMSYRRFLLYDTIGAFLWSAGFVWLGWIAGAVGARSGLTATLVIIGGVAIATTVIGVIVRRRFSGGVSVS
jgi:membrane protein DedA with SNARE-associated domain